MQMRSQIQLRRRRLTSRACDVQNRLSSICRICRFGYSYNSPSTPVDSGPVRSASGRFRADRVERRARRDEERAPLCAAKRQAAGPLGNLEYADRLSVAIVDPDLIACDEDIARNVRDD